MSIKQLQSLQNINKPDLESNKKSKEQARKEILLEAKYKSINLKDSALAKESIQRAKRTANIYLENKQVKDLREEHIIL
ncbi:12191_t:CDS:2 [Gigaspora margarita]|uniref:12191_t:CDS:1 n=1 Tax=Gigaspora margarita TaxID=4874 RepID=A0ABN7VCT9_GIGMA|nr:12191_t:CDS:2 [Gigaspora margarita]